MSVLKGILIAFSMYSAIPVPKVQWNEKNMEYVLCGFPLVGIATGVACWLSRVLILFLFAEKAELSGALIIPTVILGITGGIHMDGFVDTMDALHSWKPREKKLEILKDSHIGAFGAMGLVCIMFLQAAFLYRFKSLTQFLLLGAGFCVSRTLSAISLLTVRSAKQEGSLYAFASASNKKIVLTVLAFYLISEGTAAFLIGGIGGMLCVLSAIFPYCCYVSMSEKQFGGLTGDLAGWFVVVCETFLMFIIGCVC